MRYNKEESIIARLQSWELHLTETLEVLMCLPNIWLNLTSQNIYVIWLQEKVFTPQFVRLCQWSYFPETNTTEAPLSTETFKSCD